jgi:hypothetical protein
MKLFDEAPSGMLEAAKIATGVVDKIFALHEHPTHEQMLEIIEEETPRALSEIRHLEIPGAEKIDETKFSSLVGIAVGFRQSIGSIYQK